MKKIKIFGIPSSAGALFQGTEMAPQALRKAGLIEELEELDFLVEDMGDVISSDDLIRHNIGPVRNWPSPRIVWEAISEQATKIFSKDALTIILGGDCSIEVGSFSAFRSVHGQNSHLLVIDGHVDTVSPKGDACIGAAGMGLWFLTQDNRIWWKEAPTSQESISVIGPHKRSENDFGIKILPLKELQHENMIQTLSNHLASIPKDSSILVHFDVDVLHESIMPAAYSPSQEGLDRQQAITLFTTVLNDPRVKAVEVTEYSGEKDHNGKSAAMIIELLSLIR